MIVYLDLDRTIFQTTETPQLWKKLAQFYPELSVEELEAGRKAFYGQIEDLYYYDFGSQLLSLGIDPSEAFSRLVETELADGRFEFPGASELVTALQGYGVEVQVLTFGIDDFQRFKASLCPALRGLPVITTLERKGLLFESGEVECWLVDDKAIGDELPGNVSFVQVSLEGHEVADQEWPVYRNLREVKEFFDGVLSS